MATTALAAAVPNVLRVALVALRAAIDAILDETGEQQPPAPTDRDALVELSAQRDPQGDELRARPPLGFGG